MISSACVVGGLGVVALGCGAGDPAHEQVEDVVSAHHAGGGVLKARIDALQLRGDPFLHRTGHQVVAIKDDIYIARGVEDDIATQTNTFRQDLFRLRPGAHDRVKLKELRERGDEQLGPVSHPCMVGDRSRGGSLLAFGGAHYIFQGDPGFPQTFNVFDKLWRYDIAGGRWSAIEPTGAKPAARVGCSAEFHGGSMYMFGGLNRFFGVNNELWRFDTGNETWTQLTPTGPVPPARFIGATVVDNDAGKIYLFNGHRFGAGGETTTRDFWVYDIATNTWRELNAELTPRRDEGTLSILRTRQGKKYLVYALGHTAAPARCVGFTETTTALNEVWAFDPDAETWQQLEVLGDAPRLEFVRGATVDNKHYLVGGWFDVPDPVNICRQVWNDEIYELTLVDR